MIKAIFGGTFDPPHAGHIETGKTILERGLADRIVYVPAPNPPHKLDRELAPFSDRITMLRLAVEGYPGFEVSDVEEKLGGTSYTIRTFRWFSEHFPDDEFLLVIGADSLLQLHLWKEAERLAENCRFLSLPRPGCEVTLEELQDHWPRAVALKLFRSLLPDFPEYDVSSTGIRSGATTFNIYHKVMQYIKTRRLYNMASEEVKKPTPKELADICAELAYDRKAQEIITLDMTNHSAVAEYFVICTGNADPHLRAISERIQRDVREKYGIRARNVDGTPESHWMIVDFGNVMVHIFTDEARQLYQLENLWKDAPKDDAVAKLEKKAVSSRLR